MAKSVYKYAFATQDEVQISMVEGAKILSLQTQNNIPCIWCLVDRNVHSYETRFFRVFGTGHFIPDYFVGSFIGTYQINSNPRDRYANDSVALVFHVFEVFPLVS